MGRKKFKKKKFRPVVRVKWNVAHFDLPKFIPKEKVSRNMLLQCTKCYYVSIMTIERAFKGVRCAQCNRIVIADPKKGNFKVAPTIRDNKTLAHYRVNTVRA